MVSEGDDSDTIASHNIGAVSLKRYMAGKGRKSNIQGASHYPPE
ncbi:unannotated protein [freshwater metagenome]|uniref:Unannotated protein n=1 Tax=freshwater metagenome TaxID=449393 RepID=A0A6J7S4W3_9ZZZZ